MSVKVMNYGDSIVVKLWW